MTEVAVSSVDNLEGTLTPLKEVLQPTYLGTLTPYQGTPTPLPDTPIPLTKVL